MILDTDVQLIDITSDMIQYVNRIKTKLGIERTKESEIDTEVGLMGELVFAKWWYGDYMKGNTLQDLKNNFGHADFDGKFEIKASCHRWSEKLHLPVREDYANKRTPQYYVQVLFDTDKAAITTETRALIIGWIHGEQAKNGELRAMGKITSFKCYLTPFTELSPMSDLREIEGVFESYDW